MVNFGEKNEIIFLYSGASMHGVMGNSSLFSAERGSLRCKINLFRYILGKKLVPVENEFGY